jgi:hypothetical protein
MSIETEATMIAISFTFGLRHPPRSGNRLAFMHGHHPETHNYWPACARKGLAAPRRPSLVIQKIHRLGVGVAINRQGRKGYSSATYSKLSVERRPQRSPTRKVVHFNLAFERQVDTQKIGQVSAHAMSPVAP